MANNRKLISWRIDSLDPREQEEINAWLDQQQNIQKSITNIVQHMISRFGMTDIMSYDNQRALYTDPENTAGAFVAPVVSQPQKEVVAPVEEHVAQEPKEVKPEVAKPKSADNLYDDLNL